MKFTQTEFVECAASLGYASKKTARKFAGDRVQFTEADFEELFRFAEREAYLRAAGQNIKNDAHAHRVISAGCRTTKNYRTRNSHDDG